jgi:hypothetical protein
MKIINHLEKKIRTTLDNFYQIKFCDKVARTHTHKKRIAWRLNKLYNDEVNCIEGFENFIKFLFSDFSCDSNNE